MSQSLQDRIGRKKSEAESVRGSLEPLEATLQSRKGDLAVEPQTEVPPVLNAARNQLMTFVSRQEEVQQQMQAIGQETATRANGAFSATEPELSNTETSEFEWGQEAAKNFEKEIGKKKHKATSTDEKDLEALEHEVADNEANEEADDRRKASAIASQMKSHEAELRLENQEQEQADDLKKDQAQLQMRNRQADSDQASEEAKLQEELEKMTSSQVTCASRTRIR